MQRSHAKAIFIVHFAGIPMNMSRLMEIAEKHGLYVVEDCALAVGATIEGKSVGLWGDMGCFSFHPVKHITTGEGGMFVSKNLEFVKKADKMKCFGMSDGYPLYDVDMLGINYRLPETSAALGIGQCRRIEETLSKNGSPPPPLCPYCQRVNSRLVEAGEHHENCAIKILPKRRRCTICPWACC